MKFYIPAGPALVFNVTSETARALEQGGQFGCVPGDGGPALHSQGPIVFETISDIELQKMLKRGEEEKAEEPTDPTAAVPEEPPQPPPTQPNC